MLINFEQLIFDKSCQALLSEFNLKTSQVERLEFIKQLATGNAFNVIIIAKENKNFEACCLSPELNTFWIEKIHTEFEDEFVAQAPIPLFFSMCGFAFIDLALMHRQAGGFDIFGEQGVKFLQEGAFHYKSFNCMRSLALDVYRELFSRYKNLNPGELEQYRERLEKIGEEAVEWYGAAGYALKAEIELWLAGGMARLNSPREDVLDRYTAALFFLNTAKTALIKEPALLQSLFKKAYGQDIVSLYGQLKNLIDIPKTSSYFRLWEKPQVMSDLDERIARFRNKVELYESIQEKTKNNLAASHGHVPLCP